MTSSFSEWTREEDKAFEIAAAQVNSADIAQDKWEELAFLIPGNKTIEDIKQHYQIRLQSLDAIGAGSHPTPIYTTTTQYGLTLMESGNPTLTFATTCDIADMDYELPIPTDDNNSNDKNKNKNKNENEHNNNASVTTPANRDIVLALPALDREVYSNKDGKKQVIGMRKGKAWTMSEHKTFLVALERYGRGKWNKIAADFFSTTRTAAQVASHAQKFFERQNNPNKNSNRPSIFDITFSDITPIGGDILTRGSSSGSGGSNNDSGSGSGSDNDSGSGSSGSGSTIDTTNYHTLQLKSDITTSGGYEGGDKLSCGSGSGSGSSITTTDDIYNNEANYHTLKLKNVNIEANNNNVVINEASNENTVEEVRQVPIIIYNPMIDPVYMSPPPSWLPDENDIHFDYREFFSNVPPSSLDDILG